MRCARAATWVCDGAAGLELVHADGSKEPVAHQMELAQLRTVYDERLAYLDAQLAKLHYGARGTAVA